MDTWMEVQEAFLLNEDMGDSINTVEMLLKAHDEFEAGLRAQVGEEGNSLEKCKKRRKKKERKESIAEKFNHTRILFRPGFFKTF